MWDVGVGDRGEARYDERGGRRGSNRFGGGKMGKQSKTPHLDAALEQRPLGPSQRGVFPSRRRAAAVVRREDDVRVVEHAAAGGPGRGVVREGSDWGRYGLD